MYKHIAQNSSQSPGGSKEGLPITTTKASARVIYFLLYMQTLSTWIDENCCGLVLSTLSVHFYKDVFKQPPDQKFNMNCNFKTYKPK